MLSIFAMGSMGSTAATAARTACGRPVIDPDDRMTNDGENHEWTIVKAPPLVCVAGT